MLEVVLRVGKRASLGYRKQTVAKIHVSPAETPVLEIGRILKKKLSALRVKSDI